MPKRVGRFYGGVVLIAMLSLVSCARFTAWWERGPSPEERLLSVFQRELDELKTFESGSYVDYMMQANRAFAGRQVEINGYIIKINDTFDGLTEAQKIEYQTLWRGRFQPVVTEIYARTKKLVVAETAALTPERMSRIRELSMERQALAKEVPSATLKAAFFVLPEESP